MTSPAPSTARKSTFFHSLKKTFLGSAPVSSATITLPTHSADGRGSAEGSVPYDEAAFDALVFNFEKVEERMKNIKSGIDHLLSTFHTLFLTAHNTFQDFTTLLSEDAHSVHEYSALLTTASHVHTNLLQQVHPQLRDMAKVLIQDVDACIQTNGEIRQRIVTYKHLKSEYGYYTKKVDTLKRDGAKHAKEHDRLQRNVDKLSSIQYEFLTVHRSLTNDLMHVWSNRHKILGPLLQQYIRLEQSAGSAYARGMSELGEMKSNATSGATVYRTMTDKTNEACSTRHTNAPSYASAMSAPASSTFPRPSPPPPSASPLPPPPPPPPYLEHTDMKTTSSSSRQRNGNDAYHYEH